MPHERRLAAAGRADDGEDLVAPHLERDVRHGGEHAMVPLQRNAVASRAGLERLQRPPDLARRAEEFPDPFEAQRRDEARRRRQDGGRALDPVAALLREEWRDRSAHLALAASATQPSIWLCMARDPGIRMAADILFRLLALVDLVVLGDDVLHRDRHQREDISWRPGWPSRNFLLPTTLDRVDGEADIAAVRPASSASGPSARAGW